MAALAAWPARAEVTCTRTVEADVVALDQPIMFNRLGAQNVNGQMFALRRDVINATTGKPLTRGGSPTPGDVALRPDKRPRPLVLRVAAGECLTVKFQNLLSPQVNPRQLPIELFRLDVTAPGGAEGHGHGLLQGIVTATPENPQIGISRFVRELVFPDVRTPDGQVLAPGLVFNLQIGDQVASRHASFHAAGMQVVRSVADDGTFVGQNAGNGIVAPGGSITYQLFAEREGGFLVTSHGATWGGEGSQGQQSSGLFGMVNVEPRGARFYRSQVTEEELRLATVAKTPAGQPIVDYEKTYPNDCSADGTADGVWCKEGKSGLPILNMLSGNELVHSDLDAIITGPRESNYQFADSTYPLESVGHSNPTYPNRTEPFREFSSVWHDEAVAAQAFPLWYKSPTTAHLLHGVRDSFMINYGSGGIGSEILAQRLQVGPMHDCITCAYEEFFLTSFTVGDPAQLVDIPANANLEACDVTGLGTDRCAASGQKATKGLYPHDPANIHHSYTSDHVKFRNVHASKEQHVFHLHNHQWLFNANDDNSNYLDAQGIGPGSSYTYEIAFGGSGNRNKTAGDAIFHCHFYPHFAMGMWYMWRVHDVFEAGTRLEVSGEPGAFHTAPFALQDGTPAKVAKTIGGEAVEARYRSLPDGEVVVGLGQPAVVPIPTKAMAPMPGAEVVVVGKDVDGDGLDDSSQAYVVRDDGVVPGNPGYPFWIAGIDCGKDFPANGCAEGIVGQRPPTPPLDMLTAAEAKQLLATDPFYQQFQGWVPGYDYSTALVNSAIDIAPGQRADGGLPRHALDGRRAGGESVPVISQHDLTLTLTRAKPVYFPESGTDVERAAMKYHAVKFHDSFTSSGAPAPFRTNGAPPVASAPFMDPCIDDAGNPVGLQGARFFSDKARGGADGLGFRPGPGEVQFPATNPRTYKGANIQFDAVLNKAGYHFPQQRIIALWRDVDDIILKNKPPEPFVIRFNTFDCGKYLHTNLVPAIYNLDDYQVRTPTDIIGQHIHLPKWDLTTTDGAANGWNYEDGTFSPGAVQERIHAINHFNELQVAAGRRPVATLDGKTHLEPLPHPFFASSTTPQRSDWLGARITIQRWFFDPVVNTDNQDRGLGIIFTHDHYGPSSHQQIGLYASVLTEPAKSVWRHNETGEALGTRDDGGPTTWQAAIIPPNPADAFREFWFQMTDFQHAYEKGIYVGADQFGRRIDTPVDVSGGAANFVSPTQTFRFSINPSAREQLRNETFPDLVVHRLLCPDGSPRPCPEAITVSDPGMMVVNYRNEPVGLRVYDPCADAVDGNKGAQSAGLAGDLGFAFQTRTDRRYFPVRPPIGGGTPPECLSPPLLANRPFNTALGEAPASYALTRDIRPGDPFTPIMRAHVGDQIKVRVQVGGQEEEHSTTIHGVKWLQSGSSFGQAKNSGWRNSQSQGISEQFTFAAPMVFNPDFINTGVATGTGDFLYSTNPSQDGLWSGEWGVLRTYAEVQPNLFMLPNSLAPFNVANTNRFNGICPIDAPVRTYDLVAVLANDALPAAPGVTVFPANDLLGSAFMHAGARLTGTGTLVYNSRETALVNGKSGPLHDPTAALWVRRSDLTADFKLKPGVTPEPVVIRAAAGECVEVSMENRLPAEMPDLAHFSALQSVVNRRQLLEGTTTFNNNLIQPSSHVGLHPQLVSYDIASADGTNVGLNPVQTVEPGGRKTVRWYAGDVGLRRAPGVGRGGRNNAALVATPIEFGGANLGPADKIKQGQKALVGELVVEPEGATWTEDADLADAVRGSRRKSRTAATVTKADGTSFRDFAVVFQKGTTQRYKDGTPVESIDVEEGAGVSEDTQDGGQNAINYGTEPMWFRFGLAPNAVLGNQVTADGPGFGTPADAWMAYHNSLVGGDPQTPVFAANAGQEVRMRLAEPHGQFRGTTFALHGHLWQRDPYICVGPNGGPVQDLGLVGKCRSQDLGSNAIGENPLGFYLGGQEGLQPYGHFDIRLPSAGGAGKVPGDYLFRDQESFGNTMGLWGILRVE